MYTPFCQKKKIRMYVIWTFNMKKNRRQCKILFWNNDFELIDLMRN